jgi:hypothetical protein
MKMKSSQGQVEEMESIYERVVSSSQVHDLLVVFLIQRISGQRPGLTS